MTIDPNDMQGQQARAGRILSRFGRYVSEAAGLPSPADDGASDEDMRPEPEWLRRIREDDKAEKADQDDDDRRIGRK